MTAARIPSRARLVVALFLAACLDTGLRAASSLTLNAAPGSPFNLGPTSTPRSLTLADMDNDGDRDVIVLDTTTGNVAGRVVVLRNDGHGVLSMAGSSTSGVQSAIGVVAGDWNMDGKMDVAVASNGFVSTYLGDGAGGLTVLQSFGVPVPPPPFPGGFTPPANPVDIAVGDVNGDGRADLAVAVFPNSTARVFFSNGNGTFTVSQGFPEPGGAAGAAIGDMNGDGRNDVLFTGGGFSAVVRVFFNNGGSFSIADYGTNANPRALRLGDVDGDGKLDAVTTHSGAVTLLHNNGNGSLTNVGFAFVGTANSLALNDLDGDNRAEILVADVGALNIFSWDGAGFAHVSPSPWSVPAWYIAAGQMNGGGLNDIVFSTTANGANPWGVFVFINGADTTMPVVGHADDLVAEATGPNGANVTYTAPTATDDTDGAVPVTCAPVSGSLFALGATSVTCSASDAAGNVGTSTFKITVQDTTRPEVDAVADVVVEATSAAGAAATFTTPAAHDTVSGALTATCDATSGATFPIGSTNVTCSANDGAGNTGSSFFLITVRDTTAPVVTAPANATAEATGANGAAVSYGAASASDIVGVVSGPTCSPASGSIFAIGSTTVTCTATDAAGNTGSASFVVNVADTTAPSVTAVADRSILWPPNAKPVAVTVSGLIADGGSGIASASYHVVDEYAQVQPSGPISVAADGSYSVTVMLPAARNGSDRDGRTFVIRIDALDRSGNAASATAGVLVPHDRGK